MRHRANADCGVGDALGHTRLGIEREPGLALVTFSCQVVAATAIEWAELAVLFAGEVVALLTLLAVGSLIGRVHSSLNVTADAGCVAGQACAKVDSGCVVKVECLLDTLTSRATTSTVGARGAQIRAFSALGKRVDKVTAFACGAVACQNRWVVLEASRVADETSGVTHVGDVLAPVGLCRLISQIESIVSCLITHGATAGHWVARGAAISTQGAADILALWSNEVWIVGDTIAILALKAGS